MASVTLEYYDLVRLMSAESKERLDHYIAHKADCLVTNPRSVLDAIHWLETHDKWSRLNVSTSLFNLLFRIEVAGCPRPYALLGADMYRDAFGYNWAACAVGASIAIEGPTLESDLQDYCDLIRLANEYLDRASYSRSLYGVDKSAVSK